MATPYSGAPSPGVTRTGRRLARAVPEGLRWPPEDAAAGDAGPSRAVVARTFTYLFGAGGALALGTLLFPHGRGTEPAGIVAAAVAALVVATATTLLAERIPLGAFRWLPVIGTVLASAVVVSGDPGSTIPYASFYFWVILSAFYLFPAAWAWINVAVVGVALALALLVSPQVEDRALAWAMLMGALAVGGAMIGLLRTRLESLAVQAQRALQRTQESERALAEAQRIAHVGSWELNLGTRRFSGSDELFRILALDPGTVITTREIYASLAPDEREQIRNDIRSAIEESGSVDVEHYVDLPTRGRRALHTRARVVRKGAAVSLVGTTQDVTERRRQEEQLERTLRRLRATLDTALALTQEPDPGSLLRIISERARELLGAQAVYVELDESEGTAPAAAALRVPLTYRGVTHGVLVAVAPGASPSFTRGDEEMLRAFASSAAVAVAGAKTVQADALRRSIDAAERERRRFAHELHDQTLQGLAGVLMLLGQLPDDAHAERAAAGVREEIENLRRIIADLRPALLDEVGFAAALETLVERVERDHGLPVDTEIALPAGGIPGFGPAAEHAVYRAVQEGLTNVRRHARASRARVSVGIEAGAVVARIEDDGRGFAGAAGQGFGLTAMRERLALLEGTLEVGPGAGGGTLLEARVPLRP